MSDHPVLCRVDNNDLVLILKVTVSATGRTICGSKFGATTERNRANDGCTFCVNHSDGIPAMIEYVNLAAVRFVNKGVGVCACIHSCDGFERLYINHAGFRLPAIR